MPKTTYDPKQWDDVAAHVLVRDGGTLLGIAAAVTIGGILVGRVIKKQSRAADLRKKDPSLSYHASVVQAWQQLGHDKHPFKV